MSTFLTKGGIAAISALVLVPMASVALTGATPPMAAGAQEPIATDPATILKIAITTELGNRTVNTPPADLEALIVFVISQGKYEDATVAQALDLLSVGASDNLLAAIGNVRRAMLKRAVKPGTAAIVGGTGQGSLNGGDFTPPGVSPGGGSSNYS